MFICILHLYNSNRLAVHAYRPCSYDVLHVLHKLHRMHTCIYSAFDIFLCIEALNPLILLKYYPLVLYQRYMMIIFFFLRNEPLDTKVTALVISIHPGVTFLLAVTEKVNHDSLSLADNTHN